MISRSSPYSPHNFDEFIRTEQRRYVRKLETPDGIAMNRAFEENLFREELFLDSFLFLH